MLTRFQKILLAVGLGLLLFGGYVLMHLYDLRRSVSELPRLYRTPDFQLTTSLREGFDSGQLIGKVWLVDFIFTRCSGPCPLMTERMKAIQRTLADSSTEGVEEVRFVSISIDSDYDTPEVLSAYAAQKQLDLTNWLFLTGSGLETRELVATGFKIAAAPTDNSDPGQAFAHGTNFLLVDREGWVRAIYHLDSPHLIQETLAGIEMLLRD